MYVLSLNMWFQKLIRQFFFAIDKIVYNFISTVYDLLLSIARTSVLTQADIMDMANRIYRLLAIFMIFKVTFSLIMYVVNPDDFSDKSKGVSKLGTNIAFSLAMLILTPYIFNYAYQFQTMVLNDNALAALIFGEKGETGFFNSAGEQMSYITISPFFSPNLTLNGLYPCIELVDESTGNINKSCKEGLQSLLPDENGDDTELTETMLNNYITGVDNANLGLMFRQDMAIVTTEKSGDQDFIMDYKYIFSTIVGVIIILLLISFCMDVAVRSIKLAFLQLVAPIPIISYVDPKSGKDGIFKKWYQMCIKTYLSLFIRLIALYFAVYIISRVADMRVVDIVDGSYVTNGFIAIFIIIGALMFAKQLPKMLEGLGIKLDGDGKFTLNPLRKFGDNALGGRKILGMAGAAGAAGLAGGVNLGSRLFDKKNWLNKDGKFSLGSAAKGLVKAPASAIGGIAGAGSRGIKKALSGEKPGKVFTSSYGEAMFAKLQREDLKRKGSTAKGRLAADFNRLTGNLNSAQKNTLNYARAESAHKSEMESLKNESETLGRNKAQEIRNLTDKNKALSRINDRISTTKAVKDAQEKVDSLKSSGKFYAKVGELNANGIAAQARLNQRVTEIREQEADAAKKIDLNNKVISDMKSNGNYYQKDAEGKLLTDANGKYILTEQASVAEKELKESQQQYQDIKNKNDKLIEEEQREFDSNSDYRYKQNDMTEEGKLADDALSAEKIKAFEDLKEKDSEIQERIEQLNNLGMSAEEYTKSDGSFDKSSMFKVQNEISAVEARYYPEESRIAEAQREEQNRFEEELQEKGLDKDSKEWRAAEADNAARKVRNPQPEGWMPSPEVDPTSYGKNYKLTGFGPDGSGGPGPRGPRR